MKKDNQIKPPSAIGPSDLTIRHVYDFELCRGIEELTKTIAEINRHGYAIASVTQSWDVYTVFFRRRARG